MNILMPSQGNTDTIEISDYELEQTRRVLECFASRTNSALLSKLRTSTTIEVALSKLYLLAVEKFWWKIQNSSQHSANDYILFHINILQCIVDIITEYFNYSPFREMIGSSDETLLYISKILTLYIDQQITLFRKIEIIS